MRLVRANPLTWADSAGWTGWEVLIVLDEWQVALVTVPLEGYRVKMAVVCRSADTVEHLELPQRDWVILKCCPDSPPIVKVQLKGGCKSGCVDGKAGCVDGNEDEGLGGCCNFAITVTGSPVEVCVGCTTGMETV